MSKTVVQHHAGGIGNIITQVNQKASGVLAHFAGRYRKHSAVNVSIALCIVISLGVFTFGVGMLLVARADAWEEEKDSLNNLTLAMERDISRTISVYDLSLTGVLEVLQDPDLQNVPPTMRQAALFDRAASAEYLGSMLVLDKNGTVTSDSTAIEPHKINFSDRDYFQMQRDHNDLGLFISLPYASRLRAGDLSIGLSRRIPTPDGSFAGIVFGALRMSYFNQLFENYRLGPSARIALLRMDGRLLARYPADIRLLGRDFTGTELTKAMVSSPAGELTSIGKVDSVERLIAYRRIGNLPLVVTVAVSLDGVYAGWWRKTIWVGLALILLCGSTMALCLLFRRELKRRLQAERELRTAADRLAIAAETDALTQLGNRRHFETALSTEWRRAIRSEAEISLLLLDVDKFKLYNDRYGHPEGDEVLRTIARCIETNIRRPTDTAARYGGEEFVVILPDTDLDGAFFIAERIRSEIFELAVKHDGNKFGRVTVSIGVASFRPQPDQDHSDLIRNADAKLYEAKRGGRNRVCGGDGNDVPIPFFAQLG